MYSADIRKISQALDRLEVAVDTAKSVAAPPCLRAKFQTRLAEYEEIIAKQRRLWKELLRYQRAGQQQHSERALRIIMALGEFIRDDAHELCEEAEGRAAASKRDPRTLS